MGWFSKNSDQQASHNEAAQQNDRCMRYDEALKLAKQLNGDEVDIDQIYDAAVNQTSYYQMTHEQFNRVRRDMGDYDDYQSSVPILRRNNGS